MATLVHRAWAAALVRACALALAIGSASAALAAEPGPAAFRSEIIPFDSADLPLQAMLTGGPTTVSRTIAGELSLPNTDAARVPAVIVLHSDGGLTPNQPAWVPAFNRAGIAVFSVDSFSGRGTFAKVHGFVSIEGRANYSIRMVDAYRALDRLSRHPRIDPDRVALLGYSGGGTAVRLAAMQRFARVHAAAGQRFAAFVALYPGCDVSMRDDDQLTPAPLRVHHGTDDVTTWPEFCRKWVVRARNAGADIEFRAHDGAVHGFDLPEGIPPLIRPDVVNISRCRWREIDGGRVVGAETGRLIEDTDACVGKGTRAGPHAEARAAATAEVIAFLLSVFKSPER
jgi:dienelactone hydrolase